MRAGAARALETEPLRRQPCCRHASPLRSRWDCRDADVRGYRPTARSGRSGSPKFAAAMTGTKVQRTKIGARPPERKHRSGLSRTASVRRLRNAASCVPAPRRVVHGGAVGPMAVLALEEGTGKGAVDRPALPGLELGQLFALLLAGGRLCAGPSQGIEPEAGQSPGVALGEERNPQSTWRRAAREAVGPLSSGNLAISRPACTRPGFAPRLWRGTAPDRRHATVARLRSSPHRKQHRWKW